MRLWVDVLTPKHLIFLHAMYDELSRRGFDVLVTGRRYVELEKIVERVRPKFDIEFIGRYGGKGLEGKLKASISRMEGLFGWAKEKGPEACLSFGSPEAARVAYGLGMPHYMVCDSPHSVHVCRLTVPLSKKVFSPWIIPQSAWRAYGEVEVLTYRALDPVAWIRRRELWPRRSYEEMVCKDAIVIREEEGMASYLNQENGAEELAEYLANRFPNVRVVLLRRYEKGGIEEYRNLKIFSAPFFGPNVLEGAGIFIGRGGTMLAEAAILGVPTIANYPGSPTYVEEYLVKKGGIPRLRDKAEIGDTIERGIDKPKKIDSRMEDPVRFIVDNL